ncbi:unnamed protein product [Effrenium voratum]|nr:unnamed protein product [Effrenium voratum]CAJ1433586.1 unnamed protein product [Effrenium voratum]
MGQGSSLECCNVRGRVCEVDSLFGEDDFFREARWDDFHECQEGSSEHDDLFHAASEQAWLKCAKGTLAASYASFELHRRARRAISAISSLSGSRQEGDPPPVTLNASEEVNSASQWLGRTMAQWTKDELPPTGEGPYWARGDGKGLMVRQGPNYKKFRNKAQSQGSMYSCVSCDAIRSTVKVQDIVGRLVPVEDLPSQETFAAHCPAASSSSARWSTACKLPRVICMNLMLPYDTGIVPWRQEDPGASFVAFFHINPTTVSSSMSKEPSPEVRQLIDFFSGPAGAPQGDRSDPDRSLAGRLEPGRKKDVQSGIFKANAKCLNPEDVNVPEMLNEYNGKPCLITKSGYIIKDPNNEWVEIGIDVRGWNVLVRKMLCSYRDMIPRTKVHFGFLVQGVDDEELPEGLMCDVYVYGANIIQTPARLKLDH